jgi:large subunit ribosomal protein L4
LGLQKGTKVLILVDEGHDNLKLATRNIPGVKVLDLAGMNVYDLLWHNKLIIVKNSLPKLKEVLAS